MVKGDQLVKFRNYFLQKALGGQKVHDLSVALRGLKELEEYPIVKTLDKNTVVYGDTSSSVTFEFVDVFGSPFKGIKNIKVSLIGDKGKSVDAKITPKFNKDKNSVTVTPPKLEIGKYQVAFEVEASRTINLN